VLKGSLGTLKAMAAQGQWSVQWTSNAIGFTVARTTEIVKCSPDEYIQTGDTVSATCDITNSLRHQITKGDLGILQGFTDNGLYTVGWSNRTLGNSSVQAQFVKKCSSREYVAVGDVVKTCTDLVFSVGDYASNKVPEGSLGKLVSVGSPQCVEWAGRRLGKVRLELFQERSIRKCDLNEFLVDGDVVAAYADLTYRTFTVPQGTLGTVRSPDIVPICSFPHVAKQPPLEQNAREQKSTKEPRTPQDRKRKATVQTSDQKAKKAVIVANDNKKQSSYKNPTKDLLSPQDRKRTATMQTSDKKAKKVVVMDCEKQQSHKKSQRTSSKPVAITQRPKANALVKQKHKKQTIPAARRPLANKNVNQKARM